MGNMKIPVAKPFLGEEEAEAVREVLLSGWVTQGKKVAEFEEIICEYVGAKYTIATSSCTTALHLSFLSLGIGPGDEVILPSYTFIATANAVLHAGAKPVFVDIDPHTYNLDPAKIEEKITSRTKAILPVHQVGLPCDMDEIMKIAKKYNLYVIEDAACALGSKYKDKMVGIIGDITCFSFHPRKVITTGEGGAITTDIPEIAEKCRIIRSHGASISDLERHISSRIVFEKYTELGYNYRLTDIQAAVGIQQMKRINEFIEKRRTLAERYTESLGNNEFFITPHVPSYAFHNFQSYILRLKEHAPFSRDELMEKLLVKGIATRRGIMAIHLEPYYLKNFAPISLPETEKALDTTVILPLYPQMTQEEQDYVIENILDICR